MNNITVKKADGTTNLVYVAKRPAGSNTPAVYSADADSTTAAFRSTLTISDRRSNGKSPTQRVELNFTRPVLQTVSGVTSTIGNIPISLVAVVPATFADSEIAEAVAQFGNLVVSADVQAALKSGYAPRA